MVILVVFKGFLVVKKRPIYYYCIIIWNRKILFKANVMGSLTVKLQVINMHFYKISIPSEVKLFKIIKYLLLQSSFSSKNIAIGNDYSTNFTIIYRVIKFTHQLCNILVETQINQQNNIFYRWLSYATISFVIFIC